MVDKTQQGRSFEPREFNAFPWKRCWCDCLFQKNVPQVNSVVEMYPGRLLAKRHCGPAECFEFWNRRLLALVMVMNCVNHLDLVFKLVRWLHSTSHNLRSRNTWHTTGRCWTFSFLSSQTTTILSAGAMVHLQSWRISQGVRAAH
jgi:hypothetical protein